MKSENDQAWRRNTPAKRAERRAAWGDWCQAQKDRPQGEANPDGYHRGRWN